MITGISTSSAMRAATAMRTASSQLAQVVGGLAGPAGSSTEAANAIGSAQAMRNTHIALSMVAVADSALGETSAVVQRVRELAVQGATGTLSDTDRSHLQAETAQLISQLRATFGSAQFNGIAMVRLDEDTSESLRVQIGAMANDGMDIRRPDMREVLDAARGFAVNDAAAASATIALADEALVAINAARSAYGASANRLEAVDRLNLANTAAVAEMFLGIDQDVIAQGTIQLAKAQILNDSSTAMVAQANASADLVTRLLLSVPNGGS